MRLFLDFDENSVVGRYFLTCARIRDVSANSMLRRLFTTIAEDHLIESVLDDSDSMTVRKKGEHPYREPKVLSPA